ISVASQTSEALEKLIHRPIEAVKGTLWIMAVTTAHPKLTESPGGELIKSAANGRVAVLVPVVFVSAVRVVVQVSNTDLGVRFQQARDDTNSHSVLAANGQEEWSLAIGSAVLSHQIGDVVLDFSHNDISVVLALKLIECQPFEFLEVDPEF